MHLLWEQMRMLSLTPPKHPLHFRHIPGLISHFLSFTTIQNPLDGIYILQRPLFQRSCWCQTQKRMPPSCTLFKPTDGQSHSPLTLKVSSTIHHQPTKRPPHPHALGFDRSQIADVCTLRHSYILSSIIWGFLPSPIFNCPWIMLGSPQ